MDERDKGITVIVHVAVIVDVIELYVGDDGIIRVIRQKVALKFTGFQHEILGVLRHLAMTVPDQKPGR